MERILITGGAGYIGSRLVPELLKQGYRVKVLDNFRYGQNSLLDCCSDQNFEVIRGDCRDEKIIEKAMQDVDIIAPLSCITGFPASEADKTAAVSTNLEAIKTMLKLRDRKQKVIFFNTNSGYGLSSRDKFCTEETPMNPISLYGRTKCEAEKSILEAGNAVSLRLATVFGTSNRPRTDLLVNTMVYEYVTKKYTVLFEANAMRNYIHILDVVDAFIFSLKNWDRMKDNVYNVGNDSLNCSKLDLCNKIKSIFPDFYFVESEIGEDLDKRDYIVSSQKIYNLGFQCKRSLEDGIRELYKSYQIIRENRYSNI